MPTELEEVLYSTPVLSQRLLTQGNPISSLSSSIMVIPKYARLVQSLPHHLSTSQQWRSPFSSGGDSPPILQNPTSDIQDPPAQSGKRSEAVGQGLHRELVPCAGPLQDEQTLMESMKPIAKNALTILINISKDPDVLALLAEDDAFLETLLVRITVCQLAPFIPSSITPLFLP